MSLNFVVKTSPLYEIWHGMKARCSNPNLSNYKHYGERGICVCTKWKNSFENFYLDMISDYKKGLQLDRIDNNGNYCKENCRWVTPSVNCRNKRNSLNYKNANATSQSIKLGGSRLLITQRMCSGWSIEKSFTTPVKTHLYVFNGEKSTDASIRLGGGTRLVEKRITELKWGIEKAFTTPALIKKQL